VHEAEGRNVESNACALNAQNMAGRKRHIGVDALGLLLAVRVTAASVSDNTGGIHLLDRIATANPRCQPGQLLRRRSGTGANPLFA